MVPNIFTSPSRRREKRRQELKRSISSPIETGMEHIVGAPSLHTVRREGDLPSPPSMPSRSPVANASYSIPLGAITSTMQSPRPALERTITAPPALEEISPIIPRTGPLSAPPAPRHQRTLSPPFPGVGLPSAPDAYRSQSHERSISTPAASPTAAAGPSRQTRAAVAGSSHQTTATVAGPSRQATPMPLRTRAASAADARQAQNLVVRMAEQARMDQDVAEWKATQEESGVLEELEDYYRSAEEVAVLLEQRAEAQREKERRELERRMREREEVIEGREDYVWEGVEARRHVWKEWPTRHLRQFKPTVPSMIAEDHVAPATGEEKEETEEPVMDNQQMSPSSEYSTVPATWRPVSVSSEMTDIDPEPMTPLRDQFAEVNAGQIRYPVVTPPRPLEHQPILERSWTAPVFASNTATQPRAPPALLPPVLGRVAAETILSPLEQPTTPRPTAVTASASTAPVQATTSQPSRSGGKKRERLSEYEESRRTPEEHREAYDLANPHRWQAGTRMRFAPVEDKKPYRGF